MKKGFTLVEIMIVVAIIGLLAAIAIPSFMKARTTSQKNACINNLRQVESAKDQYAVEHGGTNGALIGTEAAAGVWTCLVGAATGYIKSYPACPASASANAKGLATRSFDDYIASAIGTSPSCRVDVATHVLP